MMMMMVMMMMIIIMMMMIMITIMTIVSVEQRPGWGVHVFHPMVMVGKCWDINFIFGERHWLCFSHTFLVGGFNPSKKY